MLGCVGLMGGYLWLKNERANRPDRIWVPIPLNPEMTHDQHESFSSELREQLITDENFAALSADLGLQQRWNHATGQDTVDELHERLIYEVGEHQYAPSLNIGFKGIRRENQLLRDMTGRLMEDLDAILKSNAPVNDP